MSATRRWTILGSLAIVAVLLLGWFLLASPKQSQATGLREQTATQVAANDQARLQLVRLKKQAEQLPEQKALLASIQRQLPDTPGLPSLIRDLVAAAQAGKVTLVSLAPTTPVAMQVTAPKPVASPGQTTTGQTPAPAAPPAPTLFRIQVAMTVEGSYFDVQRFVARTERLERTMLVTSFTLAPGGTDGAAAAPVRTSPRLSAVLQGQVFVSPTLGVVNPATVTPTPVVPGSTQALADTAVTTPAPGR